MPLKKIVILCGFCLFNHVSQLVGSENEIEGHALIDNLEIMIPTENEEVFPLEHIDVVNYTNDLEIDPAGLDNGNDYALSQNITSCYVDDQNPSCTVSPVQHNNDTLESFDLLPITTIDVTVNSCISPDVATLQETKDDILQDDDIVLVPHELINSVKKAAKKKKKLEEKQRKEKRKILKKSNKKNKKGYK